MSRLSDPDPPLRPKPQPIRTILRRRRRRPMHPETVEDLLRERAASSPVPSMRFGWLIILWDKKGQRYIRHTHPSGSYEDAVRIRDDELETGGYQRAWIAMKTKPEYSFRDFLEGIRRDKARDEPRDEPPEE